LPSVKHYTELTPYVKGVHQSYIGKIYPKRYFLCC
jgi:hypothetical protein